MTRDGDHACLLREILGCTRHRTRDAEAALAIRESTKPKTQGSLVAFGTVATMRM